MVHLTLLRNDRLYLSVSIYRLISFSSYSALQTCRNIFPLVHVLQKIHNCYRFFYSSCCFLSTVRVVFVEI